MAVHGQLLRWDNLPDEILLHILSYLDPENIVLLQRISRKLRDVCLDDELWKRHCFDRSTWYQFLLSRRKLQRAAGVVDPPTLVNVALVDSESAHHALKLTSPAQDDGKGNEPGRAQRLRDMANWDPAFPNERVSWYDEYLQRNGPTAVNWLEIPRSQVGSVKASIEVRGMALFNPNNGDDGLGSMLAVSPLDDGSVCLWDVNGSRGRQGGILSKSKAGILFIDGPGSQNTRRSKKIDTGVTECVSVDNFNNRAFFAVQSHFIEVDLNQLEVVSRDSFEWSITTMSAAHQGVPLTVGTSLGIHLHDFRARVRAPHEVIDRLDGTGYDDSNPFKSIFDPKPLPPYASLSQPTPISILHLPRPGCEDLVSDHIYVAGRFSNILHYDRRKFPSIMGSIYSGARISSLAALPYPFSTLDHEIRRVAQFTEERVERSKSVEDGRTLIAGGEYRTKGSLELYGLGSAAEDLGNTVMQNSTMKNRHTAASSIILSVINHGTKIAISDGAGLIKWFERDGVTECRRQRIGHNDARAPCSLYASMPGSDDLARKILSTRSKHNRDRPNNDNILFWTGEKLGLVSFTGKSLYSAADFEAQDPKEAAEDEMRTQYNEQMRQALERHADEVRFLGSLGMGV